MNKIRTTSVQIFRSYRTKYVSDHAGVRGKLKLVQKSNINVNLEELEQEDVGIYESDIGEISESYINYKRVKRNAREEMKQCIVKDKYFKQKEPSFLTYVEKDQIKKLHKSNPEEWTPQKLSQSFPALPDTIKKILKTHWVPDTAKVILQYDKKVIENWNNFKTGQLTVSPKLKDHLMKFRDRKINLTDEKTLCERYVRHKIDLPKPKSTFFTDIIKNGMEETELHDNKLLTPSQIDVIRNSQKLDFIDVEQSTLNSNMETVNNNKIEITNDINVYQEKLILEEFLKTKISNLNDVTSHERQVMLDTLRSHLESKNEDNTFLNSTKENSVNFVKKLSQTTVTPETATDCASLDTYLKCSRSKAEINIYYTKRIKIPQSLYKEGLTYRIGDCYYDDDGEFLYRVPGLKS